MKKRRFFAFAFIMRAMKITVALITTIVFFACSVYANTNKKDTQILDKQVTIKIQNTEIKVVIAELQKQSGVKFSFSAKLINAQRKISCEIKDAKLSDFLAEVFKPLAIGYRVFDNHIVLYPITTLEMPITIVSHLNLEAGLPPQRVITGKVTSSDGQVLPGASITIKGSTKGVTTDAAGSFRISVSTEDKTLVISYTGYATVEVEIGNNRTINAVLSTLSENLNDVVVVGYGTQRKATLTGSIATLTGKEVAVTKNENVVNMLAGKIPGLRMTQTSSQPGAFATTVDIRGMGTPLVVVDGIPRDVDYLSRMSADEIDNISVLKDASGAIYGLRSANGVILVTTKRGTNTGGVDIQYSINYGLQQFLHVPHNIDAVQYMTLVNEKNHRDFGSNYMNYNDPSKIIYTGADFQQYFSGAKQTVDWMDATFKKTVPQVQHNITMNGGNDKIKYYFNLGYMKQDGALSTGSMNYNRWNFKSNVDVNITKGLHASMSVGGYMDETNQPNTTIWAIYKNAWLQKPIVDIYANNNPAYLNGYLTTDNPMADINSDITGYSKYINRVFNGQMSLSYDIPKVEGLTARAMYSYDFKQGDNTDYHKAFNLYNYDSTSNTYNGTLYNGVNGSNSSIQRTSNPSYNTLLQLQLNYKHSFGQVHNVEAVAVYEEAYSYWDNFYAYREISLNSPYLFAGNATNQVGNSGGLGDNSSKAFVGKLNYNYKGKYLAEFAFREDGSSKFPSAKRWGFFPVGSVGWRISEEPFVKNNLPVLSNLKLRASYGKTGDDGAAGNYPPTIVGYNIDPNNVAYAFGGSVTNGVSPTSIPNPDLTWYTAKMFNIGVDFELWRGLLGGSVEYFNRNRDGLLATSSAVIPGTVGATMPQQNLNSDRTFGYEVVLTHRNKIGNVSYYINAQIGATRTRNRYVVQSAFGNSYDQWRNSTANRNTGIWWGNTELGQFQNYNQINNYPVAIGAGGTVPGDYYYQDWNGDGVIDGNDNHPIATYGLPLYTYGITVGASWKNIDLSLNFQGSAGVYYRYTEALAEPLSFGGAGTMTQFWDRWHPADPNADIFNPSTVWVPGRYPITGSPLADGTAAVQNASYVRLKTIELGYTLPRNWMKRVGVKEFRVYFSGYNLLTFTGLKDMDPEHPGGEGGAETNSVDTYKYPINKTFNIGASIKF